MVYTLFCSRLRLAFLIKLNRLINLKRSLTIKAIKADDHMVNFVKYKRTQDGEDFLFLKLLRLIIMIKCVHARFPSSVSCLENIVASSIHQTK